MGLSSERDLPETWSAESPNIRWRAAIPGSGNSSPIVGQGRVFLTTSVKDPDDGSQLRRVCLAVDFETGEILWQTSVATAPAETRHSLNTSAAPTPATDGELVFAYFGSVLVALDLEGRIVWKNEVDPDYANYSRYAAASSPVLTEDAVIVVQDREWADTEDVGWLAAFEKKTGRRIWRRVWDHTCCSYSTPLVVEQESGARLFFAHSAAVAEYSLSSGEMLWSHRYRISQMVSSIVFDNDLLCIAGGAHNVRGGTCLRLSGSGKDTEIEVLWESAHGVPETSSPILYDGKLFMVTNKGILSCLDPESGERRWRRRLPGGAYHPSLVAGDGKVYVANGRGLTTVVAVQPKLRLIAQNPIDEGGNASPAIADGSILIRTKSQLVRIEKEEGATP